MSAFQAYQGVSLFLMDEVLCERLRGMLMESAPELAINACRYTAYDAVHVTSESLSPSRRIIFVDDAILFQAPNFLNRLDAGGAKSYCVLILHTPDFDKLQRAMRYGIQDCLLASFDQKELIGVLERIANAIAHRDRAVPLEAAEASRYMFWRNDVRKLATTRPPMTQVNREYGTRFAEGLFRALFVEMSCRDDVMRVVDNRRLQDVISDTITQMLGGDCFDILYNRHSNGVSVLMNFSVSKRSIVTNRIDKLFLELKKRFWEEEKIDITMSIGRVYADFYALAEAKQEILDARWARKQLGEGRIINAEELRVSEMDANLRRQIRNDQEMVLHYMELLDVNRVSHYIEQFYTTYKSVLSSRQLRQFFRALQDFMFHSYGEELKEYGDPEALRHGYINREATAQSMDKYVQIAIENARDVMRKVESVIRRQYSQPIRDCLDYISMQHCRDVTLNDLAELVHLTPQYLSSRFHRETGQTISAYISEQKMRYAKNMLKHSEMNISEIADYLGFEDARYFSKFFKTNQHITPTQYRRIKQASKEREDRM